MNWKSDFTSSKSVSPFSWILFKFIASAMWSKQILKLSHFEDYFGVIFQSIWLFLFIWTAFVSKFCANWNKVTHSIFSLEYLLPTYPSIMQILGKNLLSKQPSYENFFVYFSPTKSQTSCRKPSEISKNDSFNDDKHMKMIDEED